MSEAFSGGCRCAAIRFVCSAEPLAIFNCHCRDCQKASGAPFISAMAVPSAAVTITGQPKYHSVRSDSGNTMSRGFCAECGSSLFARISGRADAIGINLTSLDDPNRYHPTMDIWTSSALGWVHMDPSLHKLAKGPPPH